MSVFKTPLEVISELVNSELQVVIVVNFRKYWQGQITQELFTYPVMDGNIGLFNQRIRALIRVIESERNCEVVELGAIIVNLETGYLLMEIPHIMSEFGLKAANCRHPRPLDKAVRIACSPARYSEYIELGLLER